MTTSRIFRLFIDVWRKKWKLVNSEVHLANGKRRRNSLRSLRGDGCCLPLRRKREKLRRKTGVREREREREKGKEERDKGNTGLASTQFPSLASNFRRILPSHSILPLYQRVSLHLSQLSRSSSPLSQSLSTSPAFALAHGESRASS